MENPLDEKRRSDDRLYQEVLETLMAHSEIDASDIEVEVNDSYVTLKGEVDSRFSKLTVEYIVGRLSGVADVENYLEINKEKETSVDASMSGQDNLILKRPMGLEGEL